MDPDSEIELTLFNITDEEMEEALREIPKIFRRIGGFDYEKLRRRLKRKLPPSEPMMTQ